MISESSKPTVLIVDDDPQIRDLYADFLESACDVRTADSGTTALDVISDDIDVVLLDRRMGSLSGDEVLERLREQGYDHPVALVTAVEPDFDILSMGFDSYVVKPVRSDELVDIVETMHLRKKYDKVIREYFSIVSKLTTLQTEKHQKELERNTEYVELDQRLGEIKSDARSAIQAAIDKGKFTELFDDFESHTPPDVPGVDMDSPETT